MKRRHFLGQMAAGTIGFSLAAPVIAADKKSANEKVVLALIGCGGRGRQVLDSVIKENENVEVKYLCDVNETLAGIAEDIKKYNAKQGYAPKYAADMRKVFEDKDVDAVLICTPEHWHTLATIWALQADKHIYVEKNPTLSVWEGRKMVEAAAKYNKVVQIGFQNRSAPYGFSARDYILSGKLGKVVHVKCYNMLGGQKWMPKEDTSTPAGLNWDAWQGPAKHVPYNPNRHSMTDRGGWLDFWSYGGGALSDDASHVMDLARLALNNPGHPKSVYCSGGNIGFGSQKETPEFLNITYDFGDYALTCESGSCTGYMSKAGNDVRYGTKWPYWPQYSCRTEIYGSERLMYLGRHGCGWQVMEKDGKIVAEDKGYFPDKFHHKNFINAIRIGEKPNGDVLQGHLSASLVHLANIAYRTGKQQLHFDGTTEKFVDNKKADYFLKGNYQAPYVIPDKV
jgi:predicted dehydrogenase